MLIFIIFAERLEADDLGAVCKLIVFLDKVLRAEEVLRAEVVFELVRPLSLVVRAVL